MRVSDSLIQKYFNAEAGNIRNCPETKVILRLGEIDTNEPKVSGILGRFFYSDLLIDFKSESRFEISMDSWYACINETGEDEVSYSENISLVYGCYPKDKDSTEAKVAYVSSILRRLVLNMAKANKLTVEDGEQYEAE